MNVYDYFFENTSKLKKDFLVGKEEISFEKLNQDSLRLAKYLSNSLGENKHILLVSPNNLFFVTVYLAILKSGNVCIPVDPMIELDKFKFIRKKTDASLIFCNVTAKKRLELSDSECFTSIENLKPKTDFVIKESGFDPNRCAELIFTSGSTGAPKGVMLTHKNIMANTDSILDYLNLNEKDRMLVVLPFYYCYGLSLLHTHLRIGASLVFNNSFIFLGSVLNNLNDYKCTGFAGVPSHFQILLRKSDSFKNTEFPHLRYVTQAGGKLDNVFIDEFKEAFPKIDFFVMYGQTEATARLSYLPPKSSKKHKGSIGKGIAGVSLKVINEFGKEVTPGEIGEIIAKGDNIMKGYFKDKKETEKTLKNGWLYTGDIGTVDDEGYIYLTARKKEILKVGGKRISPKEIESVILSLKNVIDCTVEGIESELLGEALKATVTVNNCELNEDALKKHCAQHLELYKIPHIFEIKRQVSISATGKKIKLDTLI